MGMQSSRMIYKGKDHKDIYFQGKYHDAMYLGYELLWHKIKQEGYYVLIVSNGKEGREDGVYIIVFDEKTGEFEIVMEVKDHPDILSENFFGVAYVVDGKRIYVSNIVDGDTVYASIDGIHFENTYIKLESQSDYLPFFSRSYHGYSEKNDSGFEQKVYYMWYVTGETSHYYIRKSKITKSGNQYAIESKNIDTGLKVRTPFPNEEKHFKFFIPYYGDSRFGLHVEEYLYTSFKEEYERITVKYYDTELETSGDIVKFQYKRSEYMIGVYNFFCANNYYIFLAEYTSSDKENGIWMRHKMYAYYSKDGIMYDNSIVYDKTISVDEHNQDDFPTFPRVNLILYRNGMYYLYGDTETNDFYKPPYTVFLTTDLKHFQKKKIPREINVDGETFNTRKLVMNELNMMNKERIYFCKGKISDPEYGILTRCSAGLIYIDNMFFRESSGNKLFRYL